MPKKQSSKQLTKKEETKLQKLTPQKVTAMLGKSGASREEICKAIARGLVAERAIVADGEIISHEPDTRNQLHAAEIALDIIGERKFIVPSGDTHYHFTNILQLLEAYDRGDPRAVRDAEKFFDTEGISGETAPGESQEEPR